MYQHDGQCCCSPDGRYIAHNEQSRIVIRHVDTLKLHTTFTAEATIGSLQWSSDSGYILATLHRSHVLQVFSLSSSTFACRVEESLGFDTAIFAPDSRHILTSSTLSGRATLYSLTTNHSYAISSIKHSLLISFSPDAATLATIERHNHHDLLALYSLTTHQPLLHIPLPTTDTARIQWSVDSSRMLCIDNPLYGSACCVRVVDGWVEWEWSGEEGEGGVVGLGVKCGAWSGCGRWLALGRLDERVEVWHVRTWTRVLQWQPGEKVDRSVIVYEEKTVDEEVQATINGQENDDPLQLADLVADDEQPRNSRHRREWSQSSTTSTASSQCSLKQKAPHLGNGSRPISSSSSRPLNSSNRASAADTGARGVSTVTHKPHRASRTSHYCVAQLPFTLLSTQAALPTSSPTALSTSADSPPLSLGGGLLLFSADGSYCSFRLDSQPRCLFILSVATLSLHSLLVQLQPITDARWQPQPAARRLLLCGGGKLYGWGEDGCSVTSVPHEHFDVERFEACSREKGSGTVLLSNESKFCCMYKR